ncbi:hypothetical protein Tco_0033083, partial [Tanacetum coccineum]
MHNLTTMNLSTSSVHRYKNKGRHRLVMLIRQTCILSINTILLHNVGQKIIHEENTVIRNKSRLVAKGYAQKEGIDFEEGLISKRDMLKRKELISKRDMLKRKIMSFATNLVAWYDELSNFLVSEGFSKGSIDPTLFITKHREDI